MNRLPHSCLLVLPGDDLRTGEPRPELPERAQQAAVTLLPRGDAEEPSEAAGETSAGGAAEDGPAAQAGGGDGEEEETEGKVFYFCGPRLFETVQLSRFRVKLQR